MENRESIVRKLRALKELADHPGTEIHLAQSALHKYNALMEQYRLTETDLELKGQGAEGRSFRHSYSKKEHEIIYVTMAISRLCGTRSVRNFGVTGTVTFFGTKADCDYAEWLYRLCFNAIEQSWEAYRKSPIYKNAMNEGSSYAKQYVNYRRAFAFKLADMIDELASENEAKGTGTSLVVVKNELIEKLWAELGIGNLKKGRSVSLNVDAHTREAIRNAYNEASKVKLRQELHTETLAIEDQSNV